MNPAAAGSAPGWDIGWRIADELTERLLCTWADQPGQPHRLAVLQVQRDQHDAQQFWLTLLTAIRQASAMASRGEPPAATPDFALLTEILDVLHGSSLAAHDQASPPLMEQLSQGELRVLRYLPTNLSRPEIASELSVSVNTVNTHVRNIYAKLQVGDRSSAVQRARALRLLRPVMGVGTIT